MVVYAEETVRLLLNSESVVIYGAGKIAQTVYYCMARPPYELEIACFLVTSLEGNPREIEGISVITADEWENKESVVLIAVMDGFLESIQDHLQKCGYSNVLCVTYESDLWAQLRGNYFWKIYENMGMKFIALESDKKMCGTEPLGIDRVKIYVVASPMDRKTVIERGKKAWETAIYAGAALADKRLEDDILTDKTGENISEKNRLYCELTALYWIWKHDTSEYMGLSHYRRRFELDDGMIAKLYSEKVDVVLTIPVLNYPSVHEVYAENHCVDDWDIMMEAIQTLYPEYYKTAECVQNGNFYYGYNMMIARREVLESYCEWLFEVLRYCETKCEEKPRYLGYLGERLLGIYFLKNWSRYKIVHAERHFMRKEM